MYKKPTSNLILNGEKVNNFLLKLGVGPGYPLLPFLFNIILDVLADALRHEKNYIERYWKRDIIIKIFIQT